MSIKVSLEHRTSYTFAHPVNVGPHVVRLRPAPHARTPIEAYSLQIEPRNHFLNWQQDPFGNWQARIVFPEKVSKLEINVGVVADLMVINPFDFFIEEACENFPFSYEPALAADLAPYLVPVPDPEGSVNAWRESLALPAPGMNTTDFLVAVNAAVHAAVGYSVRMEPGVQTPDFTLSSAIGSCRDSAWLQVAVLRQYGLAARFVSGYLVQLAADEKSLDGPSGPEQDFTDLHAWTEVYVPGAGWIGLDPTSALFAGEGHIPLSATPHPSSAAPIEGLIDPVEVEFAFSNVVTRVHEDPRVTKPYTDEQWVRIDALGEAVDLRLHDGDVRLTMGGEPTFVALDPATDEDDAAQWSTEADGPGKRTLAGALADALRQAYAENGIVHRGQGKWYPGEELPRWNIALQWRADKEPLWHDPALFADPWDSSQAVADAPRRAAALAAEVTRLLGLPAEHLLPAYEDPFAAVAADAALPEGPPPAEDPRGRNGSRELLGRLDRGLNAPTGHVLPLTTGEDGWTTPAWRFRRGRLVLLTGTSPVGLRLPLDSISWTDPAEPGEPSYLVAGEPLVPGIPTVEVIAAEGAPTTALTFEGRDGFVHVFLPPTTLLEDYAALLLVIEKAAAALAQPLVIEGYGPPPDPRLVQLVVTPDPGVIEVNVQPVASWAEQRELTTTLYDLARRTRLSTEKFDLDGTHTGTGGGNHITLGGTQPVDSPLLRRPDLLVSMVGYWQRHPSLSYLFSGRFVGPTSQAPRFDEGRPEAVYEMEIAFAEIARLGRRRGHQSLDGRPCAAAPAHRPGRQHPPLRVLHRQALRPRLQPRTPRAAGAARVRDAPAPADGAGAGAAGPLAGRDVLGAAAHRSAGPLGHRAARRLPAPAGRDRRHPLAWSPTSTRTASSSRSPGWRRSPSSGSPGSGWPRPAGSSSSCGPGSSRGWCSARRPPPAAPRATSTPRWNASRSPPVDSSPGGTWSRVRVYPCR